MSIEPVKWISESDVDLSHESYKATTVQGNFPLECINAFMSHKAMWIDCHPQEWYKRTPNTDGSRGKSTSALHEAGRQIKGYLKYHLGKKYYRGDITPKEGEGKGRPAIVCGSGPSLDMHIESFKDWEGGIFVSQSQAATVRYHGADPTHVVIFDAKAHHHHGFIAPSYNYAKTTLLTSPTCDPAFFLEWGGPVYYYRITDAYDKFYSDTIPTAFHWITMDHAPFACSVAAQIGLAHFLGYDPIYLYGVDFSYPAAAGISRATNYAWERIGRRGRWAKRTYGHPGGSWIVKVGDYVTDAMALFYRRTTMALYWLDAPNLIDCSNGLLTGLLPKEDGGQVIKDQGRKSRIISTKEERRLSISPWLAANGQFWVEMEPLAGTPMFKLLDSQDWKAQVPFFLKRMKDAGENLDIEKNMANIKRDITIAHERGYRMWSEGKK